jgi:hypothetical protein
MTKTLYDIEVGDKVARKGGTTFERPFEVTKVDRMPDGGVIVVYLEGGRFWPFDGQVSRAKATEIEVA